MNGMKDKKLLIARKETNAHEIRTAKLFYENGCGADEAEESDD